MGSALLTPADYSLAMAAHILDLHAGGLSIVAICAQAGFPSASQLHQWVTHHPDFAEALDVAKRVYSATLINEAVDIADDASRDYKTVTRQDGRQEQVFDHEHATRSKLRVDVRKWVASRVDRGSWGDSKQVDINAKVLTVNMTDDELDKRLEQARMKLIEMES